MKVRAYDAHQTQRQLALQGRELAPFQRRAWAFLIDLAIGVCLFLLLTTLWLYFTGEGPNVKFTMPDDRSAQTHESDTNLQLNFFANWYSVVWWVLYFGLTTYFGAGRTPGKRLLKVRTVSVVHERLSLWHSIERALGYGASALEFGFGFAQYFIHPNRQTVHDRIAETIVVADPSKHGPIQAAASAGSSNPSDDDEPSLLGPLLDAWDRNNRILVNLLRAVPEGGLEVRATAGGPSVAELFAHMHYVRLAFVQEDAPESAEGVPDQEWVNERDPERIARWLTDSARVVRGAMESRLRARRNLDQHYDHPMLLLQHMLWHEAYHHGQIKLALKLAGRPITDETAGPVTWGVWMRKLR